MQNKMFLNTNGSSKRDEKAQAMAVHAIESIKESLNQIAALFPPEYRITFLARHSTAAQEGKDCDLLLTTDTPDKIVEAVQNVINKKIKKVLV